MKLPLTALTCSSYTSFASSPPPSTCTSSSLSVRHFNDNNNYNNMPATYK